MQNYIRELVENKIDPVLRKVTENLDIVGDTRTSLTALTREFNNDRNQVRQRMSLMPTTVQMNQAIASSEFNTQNQIDKLRRTTTQALGDLEKNNLLLQDVKERVNTYVSYTFYVLSPLLFI